MLSFTSKQRYHNSCICGRLPHLGHLVFDSSCSEACTFLWDEEKGFIMLRHVGIHLTWIVCDLCNFQNKLLRFIIRDRSLADWDCTKCLFPLPGKQQQYLGKNKEVLKKLFEKYPAISETCLYTSKQK